MEVLDIATDNRLRPSIFSSGTHFSDGVWITRYINWRHCLNSMGYFYNCFNRRPWIFPEQCSLPHIPSYLWGRIFSIQHISLSFYVILEFHQTLQEAEKNKNGTADHSTWRNYDDLNEFFWSHSKFSDHISPEFSLGILEYNFWKFTFLLSSSGLPIALS